MGPPIKNLVASRGPNRENAARKRAQQPPPSSQRDKKHGTLPLGIQQNVLDVFDRAFAVQSHNHNVRQNIQEVKGHLFKRDFATAFGKVEYLEAYAARWSAARALAYADIFLRKERQVWFTSDTSHAEQGVSKFSAHPMLTSPISSTTAGDVVAPASIQTARIACIGGGAGAEVVALAAAALLDPSGMSMDILAIDVADWTVPLQKIRDALVTPPALSVHASQAVRDANNPIADRARFSVAFLQRDILEPDLSVPVSTSAEDSDGNSISEDGHHSPVLSDSGPLAAMDLVTIMFTLNELFSSSLSKTTDLLLQLTDSMKHGAHLVVVDSPGSYSEIKLGKSGETKRYPMKWLLDHTLLEVAGKGRWNKIEDHDSIWFRLDDGDGKLKYPLKLENCRYQIHVYRKQQRTPQGLAS